MNDQTDSQLLRAYAEHRSDPAFAELVRRHLDFVYSAALRMVCDSHLAQDVTQGVFVALAKNAAQLTDRPVLSGWLHRTAQNIAAQTVRTDVRRRAREQEAVAMNELLSAEPDAVWEQIAPHLDAALGELSEPDRDALLLRYFERKSARAMAQALGTSEDAAQKRVSRAVERLREFFTKRGITAGASGLVVVISANSVQAAPVGLAVTVTAMAKGAAAGGSTLTLIKGALKVMAWAKAKTAMVVGVVAILAAGTTAVVVIGLDKKQTPVVEEKLSPEDAYLASAADGAFPRIAPPALFVRPTHFSKTNGLMFFRTGDFIFAAGRNVPFTWLLDATYLFKPARMILPADVPTTNFDFLATLPNSPNETFQAAIKKTLGWTAHTEIREANVLLLKFKIAGAPGLIPGVATNYGSRWLYSGATYHATNMPISDLREFLEDNIFQQPVLDQTGLTNKYDINLDWDVPPSYPMQSFENSDSLKKVLLEQLGLELVPARERIEMLVVGRPKESGSTKTNESKL